MAAIKATDTKPELFVRRALHGHGLRFRLHAKELPGKPDIVLPKYRAVILVQGCFWHGHDCHLFKWPKSRGEFWRDKIGRNVIRDNAARSALSAAGWRVGEVWECALKGRSRLNGHDAMQSLATWIRFGSASIVIRGKQIGHDTSTAD